MLEQYLESYASVAMYNVYLRDINGRCIGALHMWSDSDSYYRAS